MKILTIPHDANNSRKLFGLIGEACASSAIRIALGAPITSTAGKDTWLIAVDDKDAVLGFCALQKLASRKAAKLHALYSPEDQVVDNLRRAAVELAGEWGVKEIGVVDMATRSEEYEVRGWKLEAMRGQQYAAYKLTLEG